MCCTASIAISAACSTGVYITSDAIMWTSFEMDTRPFVHSLATRCTSTPNFTSHKVGSSNIRPPIRSCNSSCIARRTLQTASGIQATDCWHSILSPPKGCSIRRIDKAGQTNRHLLPLLSMYVQHSPRCYNGQSCCGACHGSWDNGPFLHWIPRYARSWMHH